MQEKLPEWMKITDPCVPPKKGGTYAVRTIRTLGRIMGRLKIQQGHEKKHALPALAKLLMLIAALIILSCSRERLLLLLYIALIEGYLCTWPAKDIPVILKSSSAAALLAFFLFLPAMLMKPAGAGNHLLVILKVFLSVEMVNIFNHTTQWNHITEALRKLHIPGIFVFTLDITLKYIVLLGNLIEELLTALQLRSVGRAQKEYDSVGAVMGITFIRSTEMSAQMYEAMRCRGFTDDYRGL